MKLCNIMGFSNPCAKRVDPGLVGFLEGAGGERAPNWVTRRSGLIQNGTTLIDSGGINFNRMNFNPS